jgi:sugar phosphate isomerase/epimerase
MKNIPIAVQMYSLREECEKDFVGTLKKVAELGFDGVELAGYGGLTSQELKEVLDGLNLKVAASHISLDELKNNLAQVIEDQKTLGSEYVVCPYLMPDQRSEEDYLKLVSFLEKAGETCRSEGLTLLYHNHDFELEHLSNGKTALETIFDSISNENVKAEFDVYWLTKAGHNPVEWINKYPDRTPIVHLKDMTKDEEQFFAELGTGGVDIESILKLGEEANVKWWIVEQDISRRTPLESIEMSIQYLKKTLPTN